MANFVIDIPDDLARRLEELAAAQHKSMQELAIERLRSFVETNPEPQVGSAAAVLKAMREPPHVSAEDIAELEAAIASGRLPVKVRDLFGKMREQSPGFPRFRRTTG